MRGDRPSGDLVTPALMAYASRTGTRRNLRALRAHGWRLLVTPACLRAEGFRYALDNGAWSAHQRGQRLDLRAFETALERMGSDADWAVCPDIVEGGSESLALSLAWLPRVLSACPRALIAVQDGHQPENVAHALGPRVGIFVGGSTGWKEASLPVWGQVARERGCCLHVGRVNSARRIALCAAAGAHSFDGTSASRYASTVRRLDLARRQLALPMQWAKSDSARRCG